MDDPSTGAATGEAYLSGAGSGADEPGPLRLFFELLGEIAADAGLRAYLPHRAAAPLGGSDLDARTVYELDRAHVAAASVVIAYAGLPSFGVGIEVELAREHGVPVILVAERDRPVSRLLLGDPAVVELVRFADLDGLRRELAAAIGRVIGSDRGPDRRQLSAEVVVQRFLASLGDARQLPEAEVAALVRVGGLDGSAAAAVRAGVADGVLFGAGLRDLVGRHALRGPELAAFVLRDALELPQAQVARLLGTDARSAKRHLASARERLGLDRDADPSVIGQWLVTELIAPPTRALQLQLFHASARQH